MRTLRIALVLFLPAAAATAQTSNGPAEVAVYVTVGRQHDTHTAGDPYTFSTAGGYLQYTSRLFQPGLDLRISGSTSSVHGLLVGPRLAFAPRGNFGVLHPYAEALFGPNTFTTVPSQIPFTSVHQNGVTSEAVLGLDLDLTPHVRWRALEASFGSFSGIPNAYPISLSTGFTWHFQP